MSPSLSNAVNATSAPPAASQSRQASTSTKPQPSPMTQTTKISKNSETGPLENQENKNVQYTVFIRLPFQRGEFQDPPPVLWDAIKDRRLWGVILSGASRDLDWASLGKGFDVPLEFLLQQAAWLYERHFESMKKGMMRLGAGGLSTPMVPDADPTTSESRPLPDGAEVLKQGEDSARPGSSGSTGSAPRQEGAVEGTSTYASTKKASFDGKEDTKSPASPRSAHPGISRTPSTATVTQSMMYAAGSRRLSQIHSKGILAASDRLEDSAAAAESDEQSSRRPLQIRPRLSQRPAMRTLSSDGDAEDEDDSSSGGGFLPFATRARDDDQATPADDTTTNLRSRRPPADQTSNSDPPSSATSSNQHLPARPTNRASALSPRHRAQLNKATSGSEGSPSMGSSFSELDDSSVGQSALEDALLSHVRGGGSIGMGLGRIG